MAALVMLVNADHEVLRHAEGVLCEAGYLVAAVSSFEKARALLDSISPNLLVADIRLGAFNGLHLAIHSKFEHPNLPVIVTYARADPVFEAEANDCGAAFVVAPLDSPEFLSRVQASIEEDRGTATGIAPQSRRFVSVSRFA